MSMTRAEQREANKRANAELRARQEAERRAMNGTPLYGDPITPAAEQLARAALEAGGRVTPTRADELLPDMLRGANMALQSLLTALRAGLVAPRDLAGVASALITQAQKLQPQEQEPTSPEAVRAHADEIARVQAELDRRRG